MTRPITAGLDGSEESLAALAWAAREAVRRGVPLHAVHAWRFQDRGV
ncbi:universal stress protein, partial [Streptomyces sp. SID6013]|nr:universal stress protein [Streptomyces sp. SID6013]